MTEQMAMLQGELDNANAKIAFLEGVLKEFQENRYIPHGASLNVLFEQLQASVQ